MDDQGVIFESAATVPENMIVLRQSAGSPKMDLGQLILAGTIIEDVIKIQKNLNDHFQVSLKEVMVSDILACKTSERWQIYFDPRQNIDMQISKMNVLLKDQIPAEKRKNLQYIYLQYKDRAYYK
jgi:arginyl-tRNA--protein-N-Asp/Glu arginylyltransferase